ncbi:TatD family hydrolase [Candidatus Peregrinibacteria bacterium]|nr:TatD family hydrolase [Candidatus Peregrinibacteria bacterium]
MKIICEIKFSRQGAKIVYYGIDIKTKKIMRFIDTHSHLNFDFFAENRDEKLEAYHRTGGDKLLLIGCTMESNKSAVKFASQYDKCFATAGIHPTSIDELTDEAFDWIRNMLEEGTIKAVGEVGLDYYHMAFSRDLQHAGLRRQAALALEFDVPMVIHSRDKGMVSSKIEMANKADPGRPGPSAIECLEILQSEGIKKAIFHCFSYDLDFAKKVWEAGYMTSFAGILTYPKNEYLREAVREAPLDKLLIETDAPYLAPQAYRGQDNEPAYALEVAKEMAKVRGASLEEICEAVSQNAERIFNI